MNEFPTILELWNFNDIAKSEQVFRNWITEVPTSDSYHLELKTQLARTFSMRGQFNAAHAILDQVEPHINRSRAVEVRYCLERGRTYNSANAPSTAVPLFRQAWDVAREARLDYLAVDAAHMLAIALPDPVDQIEWNMKGLETVEQSDQADAEKWMGSLYNNMGWVYHDMGDFEKALTTFGKGLAWHTEQGNIAERRIAKYTIGRTLRSLGRFTEALSVQQDLLVEHEAAGGEDGFVSEEIGECLLALDRAEEAKVHFNQAYQLLKDISWIEPGRLARIEEMAS